MLGSEGGSKADFKLDCRTWRKLYVESLLEIGAERLLSALAATEIAVFPRLWELAADRDASDPFCAPVAPRCSVRSRSTQIREHRVFQNAAERRIVNSQSLPILDVSELLELIHKITDAAAG
jgi:hypothetical protein